MKVLEAKNISKSFGTNRVIKNFSFEVDSGEVVVLEGKSGSGKTTLMRIINNLERADGGSLKIANNTLFKDGVYSSKLEMKKYQASVGMVFQNYALFPHLTVFENLCLAPRYLKLYPELEIKKRAKKILEELDVLDKIDALPSTLSGGQEQRVAVARAVMLEPKLICFDEPTSALDRESIVNVTRIIEKLKERHIGIFIITHDEVFAKNVSDTLIHTDSFS